jgi:hypothetical protein
MQEKIRFKDEYGPAAEKPLQERYEAGELEGRLPPGTHASRCGCVPAAGTPQLREAGPLTLHTAGHSSCPFFQ